MIYWHLAKLAMPQISRRLKISRILPHVIDAISSAEVQWRTIISHWYQLPEMRLMNEPVANHELSMISIER